MYCFLRLEILFLSISLSNATNPLIIIERAIQIMGKCKLVFRFSKSDTSLRDRTLLILNEKVGASRIQRRTKSLTIVPEVKIDRSTIITRVMMLCPPLMVAGSMGFYSVNPDQPILAFIGATAGAVLGMLIVVIFCVGFGRFLTDFPFQKSYIWAINGHSSLHIVKGYW